MDSARVEFSFELVKRDGRREEYDRAKLARSLMRAGVAPYMLAGILDIVAPNPDQDTGSLRARVEAELTLRQPSAACRYATTRSVIIRASEQSGFGWVCMNPETVSRLGLRPGDTVWLSDKGTPAPFSAESREDVERGQAWLNPREMAAMEVEDGVKLAASRVYHGPSPLSEESHVYSRIGAMAMNSRPVMRSASSSHTRTGCGPETRRNLPTQTT
jgi:hypothetical protein